MKKVYKGRGIEMRNYFMEQLFMNKSSMRVIYEKTTLLTYTKICATIENCSVDN